MDDSEAKNQGGRPPFVPTSAQRKRVSVAAGAGMFHEEIAIGLGISRPTLEKHFAAELTQVAYQRRLEVLDAMHRKALKGSIAAQKAYLALTPAAAAPPATQDSPTEGAAKPVGKKAEQQAAAHAAQTGTEWADILPSAVKQ